jgi:signal transduction histidine kinase
MIRRISTKLLLAVLAAVVVPFLGFAVFVNTQMADKLSREVVLYSLKGLAGGIASQIDRDIEEHDSDLRFLAKSVNCNWAITELEDEARLRSKLEADGTSDLEGELKARRTTLMRGILQDNFNAAIQIQKTYDLILLVNQDGVLVSASSIDRSAKPLPEANVEALFARDYSSEKWFLAGLEGRTFRLDHHVSDLIAHGEPGASKVPESYDIGLSAPVFSESDPTKVVGVVLSLVNWREIQDEIRGRVFKDYFQGLVGPDEFPSAYGWVWGADADTILAHEDFARLHGQRVDEDLHLPEMVAAARGSDWGLYPEYEFRGKRKNAAFKRTAGPEQGGFGWVVGVGIDNDDIFKRVSELRSLLFKATAVVLLIAILWTMLIARRTTEPILKLREHTQRVASGDLDARVEVRATDELGELAEAMNRMTADLKEKRDQLVKAEKDAAWREMARQVAHDIKNPLTPIKLSADLLKRAKDEQSPEFDRIFARTIETISRQVAHLREIASDFHALTGSSTAQPQVFEAGQLIDEVLELNHAWTEDLGVKVSRTGPGGLVRVDPGLLRRVLINLVSNALEAMPEGGTLAVDARPVEGNKRLQIDVRDSGSGVPEEVRARLFEPYFTTRTTGTGLGLAIAKRVIEEMGGTIALDPVSPPPGTLVRIRLPLYESPGA